MSQAAAAAGPFFGGMTSMFGAVAESSALKTSAAVDRENARLTMLEGALQGEDIRRRGRAVQGEAISALAEGGASVGEGSAQDLLFQNALETEYAVLQTRYAAKTEARGLEMSARMKRTQAHAAIVKGIMGVASAALTGASNAQNQADIDAARTRQVNAYFPGGMTLPTPPTYGSSFIGPR